MIVLVRFLLWYHKGVDFGNKNRLKFEGLEVNYWTLYNLINFYGSKNL